MLDLSIVIVSWNVRQLLLELLACLPAAAGRLAWEAIVVDNASSDGSPEAVAASFPAVTLVQNRRNTGYAAGNNQGVRLARAPYLLLLNSDTLVSPGTLARLVEFMEERPEAGACSPRLVRPDGSPQPFAYGRDPRLPYLLRRGLYSLLLRRPLHDWAVGVPVAVDWVSGAAMLVRRAAWEQAGPLDDHFFMYFEDNDLCLRIRQAGWTVFYNPTASVIHLGAQSARQNPAAQRAYQQSLRYFYLRHYGRAARATLNAALGGYNLLGQPKR